MSNQTDLSPCPFCGGNDLLTGSWWIDEPIELIDPGDEGEIDSIECARCLGSAPKQIWNQRFTAGEKPAADPDQTAIPLDAKAEQGRPSIA